MMTQPSRKVTVFTLTTVLCKSGLQIKSAKIEKYFLFLNQNMYVVGT